MLNIVLLLLLCIQGVSKNKNKKLLVTIILKLNGPSTYASDICCRNVTKVAHQNLSTLDPITEIWLVN